MTQSTDNTHKLGGLGQQAEIINQSHGIKAVLQYNGKGLGPCIVQRWQGYLGEYNIPQLAFPMVVMVAGGRAKIRRKDGGRRLSLDYAMPGEITLIPRNQKMNWHVNGEMDVISLIFGSEKTCNHVQAFYDRIARQYGDQDFVGSFTNNYIFTNCNHITNILMGSSTRESHYINLHLEALETYLLEYLGTSNNGLQANKVKNSHYVTFTMQRLTHSLANKIRIEDIARELRVSPAYLTKRFKEEVGVTPHNFLLFKRIKRAQTLLAETNMDIASIAEESGFSHQSHLTRNFSKMIGMSPLKFRQRAQTGQAQPDPPA